MEETRLNRSPWARFRADRRAMACLIVLCLEVLAVLLLPPLLGLEPNVSDLEAGFWAPPSAEHPLGTDDVGRDLLARLLSGGRVSLFIGLTSAAISGLVGVPLGLLAGYRRGAWEFWIMRLADIFQTFPSIVLVLCLVTVAGPSATNIVLVLGLLGCDEKQSTALLRDFRTRHGALDCADLLRASKERGELRKDHCDSLVLAMSRFLEELLREQST